MESAGAEFENRFEEGIQAYQRADYEAAQKLFEDILRVKPYASEVHLNLGNVYFKLENTAQAETCFRKAIELDPVESNAYLNLGNLYFKQNQVEEAVHYWEIFKQLDQGHANTWLNLGIAYDQLGDPGKALENYSGFIGRSPDAPETVKIQKRFDQARKVFENNVQVAEECLKKKQRAHAKDILGKALKGYPGNAAIYKTYANLLYHDGEWQEALKNYRKAYMQKPDDASVLVNWGVLAEKLNQPVEALWSYHQAKLLAGSDQDKIAQRFADMLGLHQSRLPEALQRAQSSFRQGRWKQAEEQLQQLCALAEYFPDGGQEAKTWLVKTQDALNPVEKAAKSYLARAEDAEANGKFDHALNFYNKLLALQTEGPQVEKALQKITQIQAMMMAAIRSLMDS